MARNSSAPLTSTTPCPNIRPKWRFLTELVIRALVFVQFVRAVVIALVYMVRASDAAATSAPQTTSTPQSKEWLVWLFGGMGVFGLIRTLIATADVAVRGLHIRYAIGPAMGLVLSCYFLYLAYLGRRAIKAQSSETK